MITDRRTLLRRSRGAGLAGFGTTNLVANDLHPDRGARIADVDGQERHDGLELLRANAVLERPADMAAEAIVGAALGDQRSHDDDAAIAKAELVVAPRTARRIDRLLGKPCTEARREPRSNLVDVQLELAGVRLEPAPLTILHARSVRHRASCTRAR